MKIPMLEKLINNPTFKKYLNNVLWLLSGRVLRMIIALFVGVLVARYLGPNDFGKMNYVAAFVGLLLPITKLGLDGIISRNIVKEEEDISELLSTTIFMRFVGGSILSLVITIYFIFIKNDTLYLYMGVIYSGIYIVKSIEVFEFYFRVKNKSNLIFYSNVSGLLISASLKLLFVYLKLSLIFFVYANLIEALIAIICLKSFFKKENVKIHISLIKYPRCISLLRESWPLIFSSFFGLIYLNIDQIMIEEMLSSYEVGIYGAAVRISGVWYFIPLTIGAAIQSLVVKAKKKGHVVYLQYMQQLLTLMSIFAYVIIIPVSLNSGLIINILFGENYSESSNVLSLHIISSLFIFIGSIRGLWITNESYFKFALFSNVSAGIINIILNTILLRRMGVYGAAWATLISYGFSNLLSGFFFKPARKIVWMQIKSILLIDSISQLKSIVGRN